MAMALVIQDASLKASPRYVTQFISGIRDMDYIISPW